MTAISIIVLGVVVIFAITVFVGSPFVRSHKQPTETALDLLELQKGDHLLDLGSGDGAVLIAAANRGVVVKGYEINPILWLISRIRTRKHRNIVQVKWGNMWKAPINERTQNVYVFLDKRFLKRLDRKLASSGANVMLVSYSYQIPGKKILKTENGMHLYEYSN